MQIALLHLSAPQFVCEQFEVGLPLLFLQEAVVETVAVIEQIIGGHDGEEQDDQQDDGDGLVGLRLLHGAAVFA